MRIQLLVDYAKELLKVLELCLYTAACVAGVSFPLHDDIAQVLYAEIDRDDDGNDSNRSHHQPLEVRHDVATRHLLKA